MLGASTQMTAHRMAPTPIIGVSFCVLPSRALPFRVPSVRVLWSGLVPACVRLLGVELVGVPVIGRLVGVPGTGMPLCRTVPSSGGPQPWCDVVFVFDESLSGRGDPDHASGAVLFEYPAGFAHRVMPAA